MNPIVESESVLSSGVDAQNPWPGLVAFTEALQEFFHGRAEETDELLRRVDRKDLTVLFGQSGLGKSSLLQAGLFPRLRAEGYFPVAIRLDHATSAPPLSEQVKAAVSRAILDAGGRTENAVTDAADTLWEHFHRRGLGQQTHDGKPVRLVLVLDQFEELFAIGHASEETRARAARFLTELADLIENRAPKALERRLEESPELVKQFALDDRGYRVLICLREDYLPHLESLRPAMPSIAENRMRLTRMHGVRALEAVVKPGGSLITPEIGRQVVRFVAGGRLREPGATNGQPEDDGLANLEVEPSLLSLVCRELNNRRLALGLPQITADLLAGSRERILQDFYERCVGDQPPAVRAFVEDELVTDSGLRENIALERARKALSQRGAPATAIDELVKRRLLHLEERLDVQRVELTHDVLTPVVKKSRDERQQKEATLRAEQHAQETREKARRQRKRSRLIMAGMAVALVAVMAFGTVSYYQYHVSHERLLEMERQKERAEKGEQDASQARAEAVKEKDAAEENRKLADRNFAEARGTVDGFLTEMSREDLRGIPGMQQLREQFARQALKRYQRYAESRPDDREVALGLARAHLALGTILGQIGKVEDTVKHVNHAIAIQDRLLREEPASGTLRLGAAIARWELAYFYWSIQESAKARSLLEVLIPDLENLAKDEPPNLEARFRLAKAFNLHGNVDRDRAAPGRKAAYERSRDLLVQLLDHDFRKVDVLKGLSAPLHNLAIYHKDRRDYDRALELYRLSDKYNEHARALAKGAPEVESDSATTLAAMAEVLRLLGQEDEALKCYDEAVGRGRAVARANPNVSRYSWTLADDLLNYAKAMSAVKKYAASQKLYEESAQLLEELIEQVPDRAMYGIRLIEALEDLSYFHSGNKAPATGELPSSRNAAEEIRCIDRAIAVGRKLSRRFPSDAAFQYRFMEALHRRALSTPDNAALPFYEEMLETFRKGVSDVKQQPDSFEVGRMLDHLKDAVNHARRLKRNDKVLEFTDLGYQMGKDCTRLEGVNGLCAMLLKRADALREAGRSDEAIQACRDVVRLGKPALEKAPWHWYIRDDIRQAYRGLAELYENAGDSQNEVLAHREYLKIWGGPMQDMKIDKYVDPNNPSDEAEARRLRAFRKLEPNMISYSVPCDTNGVTYQRTVYLTNVPYPKDPLEDQAKWLSETFRGDITKEYRDSFRTIQKLAHEHKVAFAQVGFVVPNSFQYKVPLVQLFHNVLQDSENRRIRLKDEAAGLAAALSITPNNTEYQKARDKILADLNALSPSTTPNTAASGKSVLQFAGKLANTDPLDKVRTQSFHQVHTLKIGAGATYTIDVESTDFDNYLRLEDSTGKQLAFDDDSGGNLNARIVHVAAKDETVRVIVTSYKGGETGSYQLRIREARIEGLITVAGQIAQLEGLAKKQRDIADKFQAQGKPDEYRKALNKEFDIRGQQVKLSFTNAISKGAQDKVAAAIARSYLESKEPGGATIWIAYAGLMADSESLLQLAEYFEKGINVKADSETANHYRYQAYNRRGLKSFIERRFENALSDLKKASALPEATPEDHNRLGMCYGKLGRWEEAISAYQRAFELEPNTVRGTGTLLSLLEAYIASERLADADRFADDLARKKWLPKAEDTTRLNQRLAMFYGFRAIILRMLEKDATEMEKLMREHTALTHMDQSTWSWQEIDDWLKTTKLAPARKGAVETLLTELQGITRLDEKTALAGFPGNISSSGSRKVHSALLKAGKAYRVDVNGDFDSVLRIEDSQKKDLVHNDKVNSLAADLNSRLILVPTKDDSYRLVVTAFRAGAAGKFTLKIQEVTKVGNEELVKGELTAKDEKYNNGFAHKHKIQLEAGRPYTIEMDSQQYDTRLVLFDPDGKKIAAQNDGISPSNYRLSRIDFTPQITASYVILVSSYGAGKTGSYTLRVQGYGPITDKE